jgi:hypothetical protein
MQATSNELRYTISWGNCPRITDEACLYWTSLKDLKTLSIRLGIFEIYIHIYDEKKLHFWLIFNITCI